MANFYDMFFEKQIKSHSLVRQFYFFKENNLVITVKFHLLF